MAEGERLRPPPAPAGTLPCRPARPSPAQLSPAPSPRTGCSPRPSHRPPLRVAGPSGEAAGEDPGGRTGHPRNRALPPSRENTASMWSRIPSRKQGLEPAPGAHGPPSAPGKSWAATQGCPTKGGGGVTPLMFSSTDHAFTFQYALVWKGATQPPSSLFIISQNQTRALRAVLTHHYQIQAISIAITTAAAEAAKPAPKLSVGPGCSPAQANEASASSEHQHQPLPQPCCLLSTSYTLSVCAALCSLFSLPMLIQILPS